MRLEIVGGADIVEHRHKGRRIEDIAANSYTSLPLSPSNPESSPSRSAPTPYEPQASNQGLPRCNCAHTEERSWFPKVLLLSRTVGTQWYTARRTAQGMHGSKVEEGRMAPCKVIDHTVRNKS